MGSTSSLSRTALYQKHVGLGARLAPFAGWEMPVQYAGILPEARAVRSRAGLFDVSHMGRLEVSGRDAPALLERLLSANVADLKPGRARYSMVCNEQGGIIDDVVLMRLEEPRYLLVCNAANRLEVLGWINGWADQGGLAVAIQDNTEVTAMMALQGPATPAMLEQFCGQSLALMRPFSVVEMEMRGNKALISRTGYTGEDGFELVVDRDDGPVLWDRLLGQGAVPCGLGARDVLRLEAGLALHGNDIDTTTTALEAGLDRFVRLDKEFIGVEALHRQQQAGVGRRLVGIRVQGRALARTGYLLLHDGERVGSVTSGTYSPTLNTAIAMGYVQAKLASPGERLEVGVRGTVVKAEVVALPFYSRKRSS